MSEEQNATLSIQNKPSLPALNLPRKPLYWAIVAGHMTNDMFMNMGPVLLVFMSTTILPMNTAQIGLANSARDIFGSVTQPLFVGRGDRTGGRWLGAGGVAWVVGWLMVTLALALSGKFWLMVVPFALAALGSAAFHPVGAMYAAETDQTREASNTAYFFLFGQMGLAIGPALAGFLLENTAKFIPAFAQVANPLAPILALSLIAVPVVLSMALTIPNKRERPMPTARPKPETVSPAASEVTRAAIGPIVVMVLVVLLRNVVQAGPVTFSPVLFERKGWTPTEYGLIVSSFWFASALSGVVFGRLGDRYDRRYLVSITLLLAAPTLFFLPLTDGPAAFALQLASGALIGGSFSIIVVLAQHILPTGRALASGAILGFSFVSTALGNLFVGVLADGPTALFAATPTTSGGIGLEASFQVLAGLALVGGLLAITLPKWVSSREASTT
jgi:FSR family fosmidomycin resistance protein-like MFS transporter